jgi:hypothetical protein
MNAAQGPPFESIQFDRLEFYACLNIVVNQKLPPLGPLAPEKLNRDCGIPHGSSRVEFATTAGFHRLPDATSADHARSELAPT